MVKGKVINLKHTKCVKLTNKNKRSEERRVGKECVP